MCRFHSGRLFEHLCRFWILEDIHGELLTLLRLWPHVGKCIEFVLRGSIALPSTVHVDPLRRLVLVIANHFLEGLAVVLSESLRRYYLPLNHVSFVLVGDNTTLLRCRLSRPLGVDTSVQGGGRLRPRLFLCYFCFFSVDSVVLIL